MHKTIFVLLALCVTAAAQEAPVGIVIMSQGDAKIFEPNAKTARSVEMADILRPGSRIITGANGKVSFVSCAQSSAAQAQSGSEIVFSSAGFQVKRGGVLQQHPVPACHVPVADIGGRGAHLGGVAMRGETTMQLLAPVGTAVDPAQVTFRWQSVEGATNYRVALRDSKGNDFWESEAKSPSTSLRYDGDKKLLAGESYRWRVTALQSEDVLSSASAKMDVFSAEAQKRIADLRTQKTDPAETHLMLGMLYEELNAPDLAFAEYQKINGAKSKWLEEKIAAMSPPK